MEIIDDEDVEIMIALYCGNGSDKNALIHSFAELAGMEKNENLTAYDEEQESQEPCMVAPSTIRGIDIDLNVTPDINVVGDDGYDSSDPCDQEVDIDSDPDGMMCPMILTMKTSYGVDLRNRWCDCRRFQTLHYPCAYVVTAYVKVNLNVEQFVNDMYTLEHTLRVWENEFPVLPDLSTWEVPSTTFELVPDRGLCRNPKGHPQSSRIRNEIDIKEISEGSHCGLCRLPGHNRSKCSQRNYHVGQSSQIG
ncbi:hypothetical protein GOBAR_AA27409 [Gossypium barbadense]|uniref:SWIM-type domain-containing protein n=1 Tax=Gossypium barbadense TaxID=3634 RepID=A0A2P5WQ98_GOSBA|nr:hypothetical protein GOBAR_AA27409 [Gossypium barbadense]